MSIVGTRFRFTAAGALVHDVHNEWATVTRLEGASVWFVMDKPHLNYQQISTSTFNNLTLVERDFPATPMEDTRAYLEAVAS